METSPTQKAEHSPRAACGAPPSSPPRRRGAPLAWIVGVTSLAAYSLTLCPAVYPGVSACSVATALNLLPDLPVRHPVWRFAAQTVASIPLFDLPVRLNLFSAFCGALASVLLFHLIRRVLSEGLRREALQEVAPGSGEALSAQDAAPLSGPVAPAVCATAETTSRRAGLLTALAFALGAPFWSASVSLHPQTFDLLLFFALLLFLVDAVFEGRTLCTLAACFLGCLGMTESVLLVAAAPVVLILLFKASATHEHLPRPFELPSLLAGLLGLGCGLAALFSIDGMGHTFDVLKPGAPLLVIAQAHLSDLRQGWARLEWRPVLFAALPLLTMVWGASLFLTNRESRAQASWCLLGVLATLAAAACLLGLPYTPWGAARQGFHTPVYAGLATALTVGLVYTYWRQLRAVLQASPDEDDVPQTQRQRTLARWMAGFTVALVLLAPLRNVGESDGRNGAFADRVARELLALSDDASRLCSDGSLGLHLRIQARLQKFQPALTHVIPDAHPTTREPESFPLPDVPQLMRKYETFWRALEPLLSRDLERPPALASLLREARRQSSRITNELGVSLDERGCASEAALAYGHALRLDTNNRCASFNRYGLGLRNFSLGASAEQESLVLQAAERLERGFLFERCAARYGALRSQPADLLETLNATAAHPLVLQWVAYCQSRATDTLRLPPPANGETPAKETTLELATHAMRAGDLAGAETRLHAFLRARPDSLSGWSLLAGILFDSGRAAEVASLVRPAMRAAAGETGHELLDLLEGRLALHSTPPRHRDARLFFARALTHHPGLKEAQEHLLQTDLLIGDAALIEADTSDILKADPRHGPANTLLGGIRFAQQRYDEAENHLRKSVATRPSAGNLTDLADLLRTRKNLADAEKNARHALRLDPDSFLAWDTLGNILADQNRLGEAETAIGRALSLGANDLRPRLTWAKLNLRLRRTSEARQILTQAEPMVARASAAAGNDFASLSKELEKLAGQR